MNCYETEIINLETLEKLLNIPIGSIRHIEVDNSRRSISFITDPKDINKITTVEILYGSKERYDIYKNIDLLKLLEEDKELGELINRKLSDYRMSHYGPFSYKPFSLKEGLKKLIENVNSDPNSK